MRSEMRSRDVLIRISEGIIGAGVEVHKALGPGLMESAYEACLEYELRVRGFKVERQKELPVVYKSVQIGCGYRIDLLVEECVIIELKAIERILPIHEAQIISYLKLMECPLGLLMNFHVTRLIDGVKRFANQFPD